MRLMIIISAILMILVGMFCLASPGETFLALAFILGIIMVVSSLAQTASYLKGRVNDQDEKHSWIMVEALITLVLGVLVLSNQIAADAAIPMVFGLWVMFSGILRIVTASHIDRNSKKKNFWWTMLIGMLCTLGGIYAFLNPIIAGFTIAILLGILFIFQGISLLELGVHMPHEKKKK